MTVAIGQTLDDPRPLLPAAVATRTRSCSSAPAARPSSSRPRSGTTKLLRLTVPAKLEVRAPDARRRSRADPLPPARAREEVRQELHEGLALPDRRSRAAADAACAAPRVLADGDCNGDGIKNKDTNDDDGDLLTDTARSCAQPHRPVQGRQRRRRRHRRLRDTSRPRTSTTTSTRAQSVLPYPEKRPYPNALYPDANVDYDGDSLDAGRGVLAVAGLARSPRRPRSADLLRRQPVLDLQPRRLGPPARLAAAGSVREDADFFNWASHAGYGQVSFGGTSYAPPDFNHDGTVSSSPSVDGVEPDYYRSELGYYDFDSNGKLSDDERDEDADGLTNFDETHGRMVPSYWSGCYAARRRTRSPTRARAPSMRTPTATACGTARTTRTTTTSRTSLELSRNAASGHIIVNSCSDKNGVKQSPDPGRVNPFNPCLPNPSARTCARHPGIGASRPRSTNRTRSVLN